VPLLPTRAARPLALANGPVNEATWRLPAVTLAPGVTWAFRTNTRPCHCPTSQRGGRLEWSTPTSGAGGPASTPARAPPRPRVALRPYAAAPARRRPPARHRDVGSTTARPPLRRCSPIWVASDPRDAPTARHHARASVPCACGRRAARQRDRLGGAPRRGRRAAAVGRPRRLRVVPGGTVRPPADPPRAGRRHVRPSPSPPTLRARQQGGLPPPTTCRVHRPIKGAHVIWVTFLLRVYAIMESVTNHGAPLQRRFRCVRARFRGLRTVRSASTGSLQEIKETTVTMSFADSAMSRAHETA